MGFAQTSHETTHPLGLPFPIAMEWSESISPWAQNKLNVDGFQFSSGTKSLKLRFSTQAPSLLGGKQFSWLPGGYQLTEIDLARKWGSITGFQSVGYSERIVPSALARSITGMGVEVPKFLFGMRLSAYFLCAIPTAQARISGRNSLAGSDGAQIGLTLARQLRKGTNFQAEWTQTHNSVSSSSSPTETPDGLAIGGHQGFWAKIDSTLAKTDVNVTFVARGEGLANPAVPLYGPAQRTLRMDVHRKWKRHQFQYSGQMADQRAVPILGIAVHDVHEETIGWLYAPKRLPQIAVSQTLSRQMVTGTQEEERTSRVSLSKSIWKVSANLAVFHATRCDAQSGLPLWDRNVLAGEATIEIRKDRRIHMRYETSGLLQQALLQHLSTSSLQVDTRFNLWKSKVSLAPVLDLRRLVGSAVPDQSSARILLSAAVKLPRRISGSDFLLSVGSNHLRSAGSPDSNHTELTMHVNFKRK